MIKYFFLLLSCCPLLLYAQADVQKRLQNRFIMAEDGDTIQIEAGNFQLEASLWLDGKKNVCIKGAGKDQTILSFKNQKSGAEGIKITDAENICIRDLSVVDSKGDAIKTQKVKGIQFINLKTEWSGKAKASNGAYGLYPVQCTNVLIDSCYARGASDAGIYVGQSEQIIVRNSEATENVAGIEIENSKYAEVYHNKAYNNTGGILVFDLPDLEVKKGGHVSVYENEIFDNNHKNFAPKGNIVGKVPPGTGVLLLASYDVELFNNKIQHNRTLGVGIISYYITENPIKDEEYFPYPTQIHIHHNQFERKKRRATMKGRMGKMFRFKLKFGKKVPHIIWDGIMEEEGKIKSEVLCIHDNEQQSFSNIDANNGFKNMSSDASSHQCEFPAIPKLELNQP
jgi:parallel beta-helix repeat protein